MRDVYLDLEIGLSLNRAGFRTTISDSFVGLVDDPKLILSDLAIPHGDCAQRGFYKFLEGRTGAVANAMNDLIRVPANMWCLRHALQRFNVAKYHRHDVEQLKRLDFVRSKLEIAADSRARRRAA